MFDTPHATVRARAGRWTLSLLAALTLGTLLLTTGARCAHAAPPALMASENPVVIPNNATSKAISVSWNLNACRAQ